MQQASVDEYPVVSERTLLERVYYHHGLFCANHPALVIFVCGVLIFLCRYIHFGSTVANLTLQLPCVYTRCIFFKNLLHMCVITILFHSVL
jgi:hypothetical protein